MKNVCLGCEERHMNCHATCEVYKAYLREKEEVRDAKKSSEEADKLYGDFLRQTGDRIYRTNMGRVKR